MRYVLKNQEMQTVDHETIHGIGIPGLVLMERASKAVADKAAQIADHSQRILIISGIGNNGGDALACTRILLEQDYLVDYMIVGNIEKASADLKYLGSRLITAEEIFLSEFAILFLQNLYFAYNYIRLSNNCQSFRHENISFFQKIWYSEK